MEDSEWDLRVAHQGRSEQIAGEKTLEGSESERACVSMCLNVHAHMGVRRRVLKVLICQS